jgi:hypothetical protein
MAPARRADARGSARAGGRRYQLHRPCSLTSMCAAPGRDSQGAAAGRCDRSTLDSSSRPPALALLLAELVTAQLSPGARAAPSGAASARRARSRTAPPSRARVGWGVRPVWGATCISRSAERRPMSSHGSTPAPSSFATRLASYMPERARGGTRGLPVACPRAPRVTRLERVCGGSDRRPPSAAGGGRCRLTAARCSCDARP